MITGGAVAVYEAFPRVQDLIFFEPGNYDVKKARKSNIFLDPYRQSSLGDSIVGLKVLKSGRIVVVLSHGRFLIYSEGVNHQGIFSSPYQTASFTKLGPDQINGVVELPNGDLLTFHYLSNFSKGFFPGSYIQYWAYNQSTQGYFPKKRFDKNIDYIREVRHLQNGSIMTFSHYQLIVRTWAPQQMEFTERNLDFKDKEGKLEAIVDVGELDDGRLVVAFNNGYRILRFNSTVGQYEIMETINVNLPNQLFKLRNSQFITIEDGYKKVKQWKP
ncbi:MAG: hypothetical protein J0M15_07125 [Deltaproteobacteria bacterium]|nr:hypothetical protein [Deltaproteobacteria bacterium]